MTYLAMDIGASSGKLVRAELKEGRISTSVVHRFQNNLIRTGGHLCWDIEHLYDELVAGLEKANSREFDEEGSECVIDLMDGQRNVVSKGGTMRLGSYPCRIEQGTMLHEIYGCDLIQERHRHRYEVSPIFRGRLEAAGIVFSGSSPDGKLVEAMEIPSSRFFVAVQFHPEFKSRPNKVHPLFDAFVRAAGMGK